MHSMTTDYKEITGDPRPYLERIAAAGFTEVHWCHEWTSDYLYSSDEMTGIKKMLDGLGLRTNSLHASSGPHPGMFWWGKNDDEEQARGRRLMMNRMELAAHLECEPVVIHVPWCAETGALPEAYMKTVDEVLYEMVAASAEYGVRLAVENHAMMSNGALRGNQPELDMYFKKYAAGDLGYCFDCGHGNMVPGGLDHAEKWKDRLTVLHLHDNDGKSDQHMLPFEGTVDWERLAGIIAASPYNKELNLECAMHQYPDMPEEEYLARAFAGAERLAEMVAYQSDSV